MIFHLAIVDVTHQEENVFNIVNLNVAKWPATASFKDLLVVQMTIDASQDETLQPMSNHSIEFSSRIITSYEESVSLTLTMLS